VTHSWLIIFSVQFFIYLPAEPNSQWPIIVSTNTDTSNMTALGKTNKKQQKQQQKQRKVTQVGF
jgi:hypothetical protein